MLGTVMVAFGLFLSELCPFDCGFMLILYSSMTLQGMPFWHATSV